MLARFLISLVDPKSDHCTLPMHNFSKRINTLIQEKPNPNYSFSTRIMILTQVKIIPNPIQVSFEFNNKSSHILET